MTNTTDATPASGAQPGWTELLDHYRHTAVEILVAHRCAGTECTACGQVWPCRAACAAELALEL